MLKIAIAEAIGRLTGENSDFERLLERDTFDVGIYRPASEDQQTPHARDELYIVAAGSGNFACGSETRAFAVGDVFFVPAGIEHRFTKFSADFATWVVFFGERLK
jgi:mannose-6-phosphate isomerase-like protein (cupin superfamily)